MWEPLWLGTKLNYLGDLSDDEASAQRHATDGADRQAIYAERWTIFFISVVVHG